MKKKIINIFISVVITLLFIRTLALIWSSGDVVEGIVNADFRFVLLAALCYIFTYPLRAFRIFYLAGCNNGITYGKILPVCFRHQFYGRIIPFKAGELSLVYLLKKRCGISISEGGTTLVLLRVFDGFVMVLSFIICNLFVGMGGIVSYIAGAGLITLVALCSLGIALFPKVICYLKKKKLSGPVSVAENVWEMVNNLKVADFAMLFLSTVVLWVFVYLSMHFVAYAFVSSLDIVHTVAASFLASVASFLPVNGLGGFGTTEAGWTLGFMLIGIDKSTAVVSGVVSNLMSFVIVCVFGLISFAKRGGGSVSNNNNE